MSLHAYVYLPLFAALAVKLLLRPSCDAALLKKRLVHVRGDVYDHVCRHRRVYHMICHNMMLIYVLLSYHNLV
jgi:hypothetical protein